jgi:hypothetical protein
VCKFFSILPAQFSQIAPIINILPELPIIFKYSTVVNFGACLIVTGSEIVPLSRLIRL